MGLDTRLVRCPNGCQEPPNPRDDVTYGEYRQFLWWDGSIGTVRYCSDCGTKMELIE